jgi:hypothetical protein
MATGNFVLDKGYRAGASLTKFRAVKFSTTAETVIPVAAITDNPVGFAQFSISAAELTKGKGALVRTEGITEAEASAAIILGASVSIGADGRVKTAATGERVVGQCVGHPAGTAGDRISLDLALSSGLAP